MKKKSRRIFVFVLIPFLFILLGSRFVSHYWINGSVDAFKKANLENPMRTAVQGASCRIAQDQMVHLKSESFYPLMTCLGLVHGRDRAFQADILRRTFQGRQAEVLGASKLKTDVAMRLFGFEQVAKKLFSELSKEMQNRLWAYSYGMNQGLLIALERHQYEFEAFSYKPEPWQPWHSIALLLLQSFDQTRKSFETELEDHHFLEKYGATAQIQERSTEGLPWDLSVLKPSEYSSQTQAEQIKSDPNHHEQNTSLQTVQATDQVGRALKKAMAWSQSSIPEMGTGSNNWVVRSKSAWLANDPHLGLKHPPFWYWIQLEAGALSAIGASLPGVPSIASGTNRGVSWGLTNAFMDVADLAYIPWQELDQAVSFRPLIWVSFKLGIKLPFIFKNLKRTQKGFPILPVGATSSHALVLRWVGFELRGSEVEGVLNLFLAQNAQQMDKNLQTIGLPAWNIVFADTQGQIGLRVVGRVPKLKNIQSGVAPKAGTIKTLSLSQFESSWPDFLSKEQMPHALNPKRDYLVTANNRHWPAVQSQWRDRAYTPGFRALRIEELILGHNGGRTNNWDWQSHAKIQCDVQAVDARFFVPVMLPHLISKFGTDRSPLIRLGLETLQSWDFEAGLECKACALYRRTLDRVMEELVIEEAELYRWLKEGKTLVVQSLVQEFRTALREVSEENDEGVKLKSWKEMHVNGFDHIAGRDFFTKTPIPTPGDTHSVNPGVAEWRTQQSQNRYFHKDGASQRLIVEMSNPPKVYINLPGGIQDEHSPELADPVQPWARWSACQFERREFPWDWLKKPGIEIFL